MLKAHPFTHQLLHIHPVLVLVVGGADVQVLAEVISTGHPMTDLSGPFREVRPRANLSRVVLQLVDIACSGLDTGSYAIPYPAFPAVGSHNHDGHRYFSMLSGQLH
jgi:hypothetical protein